MIRPIQPLFGNRDIKKKESLNLVKFKLNYAEHEVRFLDDGKVFLQYYGNYLFYMEVWEAHIESDVVLLFEVMDYSLFFFFMLEGEAKFANYEGCNLLSAERSTCYVTACGQGKFQLNLFKGKHILSYASPRIDWIKRYHVNYPLLIDFVNYSETIPSIVTFMEKNDISRSIVKHLIDLWHHSSCDYLGLEFDLSKRFKKLVKLFYDQVSV